MLSKEESLTKYLATLARLPNYGITYFHGIVSFSPPQFNCESEKQPLLPPRSLELTTSATLVLASLVLLCSNTITWFVDFFFFLFLFLFIFYDYLFIFLNPLPNVGVNRQLQVWL